MSRTEFVPNPRHSSVTRFAFAELFKRPQPLASDQDAMLAVLEFLNTRDGDDAYLIHSAGEIILTCLRFLKLTTADGVRPDLVTGMLDFLLLRYGTPREVVRRLDEVARTVSLLQDEQFVRTAWGVEDVQSFFDVTDDVAATFLQNNRKAIEERMVEAGHEAILTCGSMENLPRNEE